MTARVTTASAAISSVAAGVYTIPTDAPESDGTFEWRATTVLVVETSAADATGLGYSYTSAAAAVVVRTLAGVIAQRDALDVEGCYTAMRQAVRNIGRDGIAASAISAVDMSLWDLKARLLGVSLVSLLGAVRDRIPLYGSGGFTSYTIERLQQQLGDWAAAGFGAVKMKIGRDPDADRARVHAARDAVGRETQLYVDANGAYSRKLALAQADAFAGDGVTWFEEPVSSDDVDGLRLMRDRAPAGMEIAAGEYGYDLQYFRVLAERGAVDVLQADATRCGGVSGFMRAAALADAFHLPLSAHTAPSVHAHLCCAAPRARNLEYFHDHARIEPLLFDGVLAPRHGGLCPDRERPGLGLTLKRADAERYRS